MSMSPSSPTAQEPVTYCVTRMVKPGKEAEYEGWVRGINAEAQRFPGHLGASVIRPSDPTHNEYTIIFRFDSYAHLRDWEQSAVRQRWLREVSAFTEGETEYQVISGWEYWFTPEDVPGMPPRYKQALLSWLAIFPSSALLSHVLGPWLEPVPPLVRTMLITGLIILLMTYVVMPRLTRWLRGWLYRGQ
jgi:uncharacterized protein